MEPRWENLDHHRLFSLSKVREPSAVPVHHGKYISSSRQCSHRPTDAVCNNDLDTHRTHTAQGGGGGQCLGGSTASSWRCVSELSSSEL